ncbi:hypothetical protein PanWU01x14_070240, partial [Parasponia andersonii]
DANWYPDSGATNHCTLDVHNRMHRDSYQGSEMLHVSDGTGLQIQHIGQSSFLSHFQSKMLNLNHLLHVPSINKNLTSVSKFAADNNVFFEFQSNQCFVKDQVTKAILMAGMLNNGLYVFDSSALSFTTKGPSFKSGSNVYSSSQLCNT